MEENEGYDIPLSVLSVKDRKILCELFGNARTPYSVIAKRVGLSKEVVNYRVKRLIERGILLRFNTVLDAGKLGWEMYFSHIQLRNLDSALEEEIIAALKGHPNIAQILKCIGNHDLILKVFAKDYVGAHSLMKEIEMRFEGHIEEYTLNLVEHEIPVPLPFLYAPIKPKPESMLTKKDTGSCPVSQTDLLVLKELSDHARMQAAEIAKRLSLSRELVSHHIAKLEKAKVIRIYRPSAWAGSKSIGFSWYFVMLRLNETSNDLHRSLEYYLCSHPNVTYYYRLVGSHDVQFEIRLKTGDELNRVLMEIRSILKSDLKSHELSIILQEHKYSYFPGCLMGDVVGGR